MLERFGPEDLLLLQNEVNRLDKIIDRACERGIRIVLNLSPFDGAVTASGLDKVSLFLVNEIEGAEISGLPAQEPEKFWIGSERVTRKRRPS